MHEYSIVSSIVERVERELAAHPGAVARKLHLKIGELAGVEVPLLRTAYDLFREHTPCEQAELAVDLVPAEWRCTVCARAIPAGEVLRCCNRPAKLAAGDDITLERIEMEVRDV